MADGLDLDGLEALIGEREYGYAYPVKPLADAVPALIAEVRKLREQRDTARDIAVCLEPQNAEALRLVNETLDRAPGFGEWVFMTYLRDIARILGAFPDDETEQRNG